MDFSKVSTVVLQFETYRPYALMLSRRAPRRDLEWLNQIILRVHSFDTVSSSVNRFFCLSLPPAKLFEYVVP